MAGFPEIRHTSKSENNHKTLFPGECFAKFFSKKIIKKTSDRSSFLKIVLRKFSETTALGSQKNEKRKKEKEKKRRNKQTKEEENWNHLT